MKSRAGERRRSGEAFPASPARPSEAALGLVAALASLAVACGGNDQLLPRDVSGAYTASRWVFVDDTSASNILAAGGRLELTLEEDGSTAGSAVIPPGFTSVDTTLEESLAGRWELRNDTVWLSELEGRVFLDSAPLAVRRVPLALTGEYPSVIVTLTPETAPER